MGNEIARELANGMRQEWDRDLFGRVVAHRALRDGALEGEQSFTWQSGRMVARSDSLRAGGEVVLYDGAGRTSSVVFGYGETISYEYDQRDRRIGEVYSFPGVGVVADIGTAYDGANRRIAIRDRARRRANGRLDLRGRPRRGDRHRQRAAPDLRVRHAGPPDRAGDPRRAGRAGRDDERQPRAGFESAAPRAAQRHDAPRSRRPRSATGCLRAARSRARTSAWASASSAGAPAPARACAATPGTSSATASPRPHGDDFVYDAERARLLFASLADGRARSPTSTTRPASSRRAAACRSTWTATGRLASHGADSIELGHGGPTHRGDGVGRHARVPALRRANREHAELARRARPRRRRAWRSAAARTAGGTSTSARRSPFVTDEAGDVVAHYRYQPFGVDAAFGPEAGSGRFENRPAFGPFYLLGERVLDPSVGRFLSPDPVLALGSQYAYAYGNPIDFADADGRHPEPRPGATIADALRTGASWALLASLIAAAAPPVAVGVAICTRIGQHVRLLRRARESAFGQCQRRRRGRRGLWRFFGRRRKPWEWRRGWVRRGVRLHAPHRPGNRRLTADGRRCRMCSTRAHTQW